MTAQINVNADSSKFNGRRERFQRRRPTRRILHRLRVVTRTDNANEKRKVVAPCSKHQEGVCLRARGYVHAELMGVRSVHRKQHAALIGWPCLWESESEGAELLSVRVKHHASTCSQQGLARRGGFQCAASE